MIRNLVALILVPALTAAPPSVEKLLRHPRYGTARIALDTGAIAEGNIVRVTDRFVALRSFKSCDLVPIPAIRRINWPNSPNDVEDDIGAGIFIAMVSPVLIGLLAAKAVHHVTAPDDATSLYGAWQSGKPALLSLNGSQAELSQLSETDGTYKLEGSKLTLDDTAEFNVNFDCDKLTLKSATGSKELRIRKQPAPAAAPIVGDWNTGFPPGSDKWSFRSDGAYSVTRTVSSLKGERKKAARAFLIAWADGTESIVTKHRKTLTVTTNGITEQYQEKSPN